MYFNQQLYGFAFFEYKYAMVSFPSGHSATAFGAMGVLSLVFKRLRLFFLLAGSLIAFSRIPTLHHYLSDVLIGSTFGMASSIFIYNRMKLFEGKNDKKKIFDYPRVFFGLIVTLQTVLLINSRALYFSDEIRYANAYSNLVNFDKWLVLYLNGDPYPDKPPVYFWLVYIVQLVTRLEIPSAMFVTSALTGGFIYLLAHYYFSMTVTNDRKISVISGMVLLTNFYFIGLMNYIRMDLLFAAFIIISFTMLYKYLTTDSKKYVYFAFFIASMAVLTKGPIGGVIFPLLFFLMGVIFFQGVQKAFQYTFSFRIPDDPCAYCRVAVCDSRHRGLRLYGLSDQHAGSKTCG